MHALRLIVGILFALAALFIGGCSLLFGAMFLAEGDDGYGFWVVPAAGIVIAPFLAWGAWALLKGEIGTGGGAGLPRTVRIAGAVLCCLAALHFLSRVGLILLFWPSGSSLPELWGVVIYLALAGAAGVGAWQLLTAGKRTGGPSQDDDGGAPPPAK